MPIVAFIEGVKIVFYANEHPPAHFHALIAEHRAVVDIVRAKITAGSLPHAKRAAVLAWTAGHKAALLERFAAAVAHEKVEPIE
jgi:Domain of unknown function (DUF4160)